VTATSNKNTNTNHKYYSQADADTFLEETHNNEGSIYNTAAHY